MSTTRLDLDQALRLVAELRQLATLPPGENPAARARAEEIGHLFGRHSEFLRAKVDEVHKYTEILLSRDRWRHVISQHELQQRIDRACDALRDAVKGTIPRI